MTGSFYRITLKDNSGELGRTEFNIGDLTALSLAGALTQMGALSDAIEAVTLGAKAGSAWGDNDLIAVARPSSKLAQRGVKWTVVSRDTVTGVPVINHIPTADLTVLPAGASEDMDLSTGVGQDLKDAIEALCKSPAGNAIVVERVYYSD